MSILREDVERGRIDPRDVATGRRLKPVHPGRVLRREFLEPMGVTPYRLARAIGVPLNRVTAILAGKRSITADTALRLGWAFGVDAQFWVNLQTYHDMDMARATLGKRLERDVQILAA